MAKVKWNNDTMLDSALKWVSGDAISTLGATRMFVCRKKADDSPPSTYAQASTTSDDTDNALCLATIEIDTGDFGDPEAATGGGRKIQVAQQADASVAATGSADYIVLANHTSSGTLMYITTCTAQTLTSGNTVTVPAWYITIDDANA